MLHCKLTDWTKDRIAIRPEMALYYGSVTFDHILSSEQLSNLNPADFEFNSPPREHVHDDFLEIFYVLSGTGVMVWDKYSKRTLQKGDILCFSPGESHLNFPLPKFCGYNCLISTKLLGANNRFFPKAFQSNTRLSLERYYHLTGKNMLEIEQIFETLYREYVTTTSCREEILFTYANLLLTRIYQYQHSSEQQSQQNRVIVSILDYISEHYTTVSLNEAAQISAYSPSYFSKLFYKTLGVHFVEYVNQLRINEAVKLLLETNLSVETIGHDVGFKSNLHFYDIFKRYVGVTPAALRKQMDISCTSVPEQPTAVRTVFHSSHAEQEAL